jgi:hypothetical protein
MSQFRKGFTFQRYDAPNNCVEKLGKMSSYKYLNLINFTSTARMFRLSNTVELGYNVMKGTEYYLSL